MGCVQVMFSLAEFVASERESFFMSNLFVLSISIKITVGSMAEGLFCLYMEQS
jgi:hypothetical protein